MKTLRERTIERWREHNPGLDTSPMELVSQIKRISELLDRAVEPVYAAAGLSTADVELLVPLRYSVAGITAIRLAEHLGMSRAGVSKTLGRLEQRGLITRSPNPDDRRSALVCLTSIGIAAIDEVFPRELEFHAMLLSELGPDRARILQALQDLAYAMETRIHRTEHPIEHTAGSS
ncbi:MarR family winged helix-turn-helix transcriptional regulator [Nocardia tengchongensis]|uniref:MarR family winged helix-turn-helix transcriptional regulator n=1 Tax=Nocardia tengchongensis TaxID=2055889 RepID=UPI0036CD6854